MEVEGTEQNIILQPEGMIVGAVTSVNGQIGDVVLTTSDLENTSDYQTGEDVQEAIAGKQDKLTAGNNIQISEQNVISATNTTYSAGNGINISGENAISVDTTVVATQQNLSDEVTNRENADIYLQGQIDAISASSDVVDIVGTYAELQAYDTQHLKDNDIIKVLQDETQGNATTYYRWSTHTQTFTLIGQEGPYYTKAGADAQFVPQTRTVNSKALSANITLTASDVGALGSSDVVQTTGTSTSQVMSQNAVTNELNNKLNVSDYVVDDHLANTTNPVQNQVLNGLLGNMPSDFFSGSATTTPTASTEVKFGNILNLDDVQLLGDTFQQTYSGKNLLHGSNDGSNRGIDYTWNGASVTLYGETTSTYSNITNNDFMDLEVGTYTISLETASTLRFNFRTYTTEVGNTTYTIEPGETSVSFTIPEGSTGAKFRLIYISGFSTGLNIDTTVNIQLEKGPTATTFEPYTGGIPAPSPSYPMPISVVTGVQNVTISGSKNLFNYSTADMQNVGFVSSDGGVGGANNNRLTSVNATKLAKGTYTLSYTGVNSCWILAYDLNGNYLGNGYIQSSWSDGQSETFTVSQDCQVRVSFRYSGGGSVAVKDYDIQIEAGNIATSYMPFNGADFYTIDLGATELCKIGTHQDEIYKSGGDWYVHKETDSVLLDTLASNFIFGSRNDSYSLQKNTYLSQFSLPSSTTNVYVTTFKPVNSASLVKVGSVYFTGSYLHLDYDGTSTSAGLTTFQTWLSTSNTSLYAVLATPTDTKITDAMLISELEALVNASTYDGETDFVITATGTNLPAPLQLRAINANAQGIIYKMRG